MGKPGTWPAPSSLAARHPLAGRSRSNRSDPGHRRGRRTPPSRTSRTETLGNRRRLRRAPRPPRRRVEKLALRPAARDRCHRRTVASRGPEVSASGPRFTPPGFGPRDLRRHLDRRHFLASASAQSRLSDFDGFGSPFTNLETDGHRDRAGRSARMARRLDRARGECLTTKHHLLTVAMVDLGGADVHEIIRRLRANARHCTL